MSGYANVLERQGRQQIEQQTGNDELNASYNYYSHFAGTGMETPGLRLAMYGLGRRKRKAVDNLEAYASVLHKQEEMQDKWRKIWEQRQQKELDDSNKTDWLDILGGVVKTGASVLPFLL